ncbi:poly(3-hydroxybutyrate) depolymerase [Cupriavidus sp. USMAA2-4]|uniref:Poly(3-hydroxybutyrate) depolymerase n=1 Tax=Cupriavidus malaysiensis TaxID=367825 RepID=A0ABM6F3M3_9BURK|nr:poly(3-hydroxybutyrate) depolymerase [Cupriavidus sp. USMAA2-4]AOZ06017.1 poly(3-hydroxybutyrate) depolymerase [Cupriavidus malaysiensis]
MRHPTLESGWLDRGTALYQLYELHSTARASFLPWLQANAGWLEANGNALPFTPGRYLAAGCQLLARLCQGYPRPQFGLTRTSIDGHRIAVSESVVLDKAFCRLLHFERAACLGQPVVLLVAPLSGHHATLLRDTVRTMLPDFDVYLTDWRDAREVPLADGVFHLDDYVAYLQEFIDYLGTKFHIVAVCQSTVPALAAVSLRASRGQSTPQSITLIGGPIDARCEPTTVGELAASQPLAWFAREMIDTVPACYPGAGRRVCPGFRQQMAFIAMHPELHLRSHLDFYFDMVAGNADRARRHRSFYDDYNAMLDMPAEYFLETVQIVFQECRLARGTWCIGGESVRPCDIRDSALITVEGEHDDICSPSQTRAALDLCAGIGASRKHDLTASGCGHYGIFSGTKWRTWIYPRVRALIYRYACLPAAHM